MNLSVKKLRRSATVIGGAIAGLGVVAAMAGPALACNTIVNVKSSCLTDNGWTATWAVQNDWKVPAIVRSVELDGQEVAGGIGDIKVDATIAENYTQTLTGVSSFPKEDTYHRVDIKLQWQGDNGFNGPVDSSWEDVKPILDKDQCHTTPPTTPPTTTPVSTPPTTPATTPPTTTPATTTPTASPSETPTVPLPSAPVLPKEIYAADCSSVTIGLDNTKSPIEYKLTLNPTSGATQSLDIKPGEKKSAKFAASGSNFYVKLTVVAIYKGVTSPPETASIPWEKPPSCSSGALAVTGSSAAPLAGGAAVVLLAGGGLFFMARRRKVKFAA